MPLVPEEISLVIEAVISCAEEQTNQLEGRKFVNALIEFIEDQMRKKNVPAFTVVTGLWVALYTLAEEWKTDNS